MAVLLIAYMVLMSVLFALCLISFVGSIFESLDKLCLTKEITEKGWGEAVALKNKAELRRGLVCLTVSFILVVLCVAGLLWGSKKLNDVNINHQKAGITLQHLEVCNDNAIKDDQVGKCGWNEILFPPRKGVTVTL